jgi:type VI secretion system secreted protein Hcp
MEDQMAVDMFLKLEGIEGESKDAKHSKEIEVLAWSWGMTQSGTFHTGSGGGSGKVNIQDLSLTKYIDKSSPTLMLYCTKGTHIKEATLVVRKAGGAPLEYVTIKMKPVMITSLSTGGSGGEDRLTENVTLNFQAVDVLYVEQKPDGSEGAKPDYKWNIAEGANSY